MNKIIVITDDLWLVVHEDGQVSLFATDSDGICIHISAIPDLIDALKKIAGIDDIPSAGGSVSCG